MLVLLFVPLCQRKRMMYADEEETLRATLAANPNDAVAHNNLGYLMETVYKVGCSHDSNLCLYVRSHQCTTVPFKASISSISAEECDTPPLVLCTSGFAWKEGGGGG